MLDEKCKVFKGREQIQDPSGCQGSEILMEEGAASVSGSLNVRGCVPGGGALH